METLALVGPYGADVPQRVERRLGGRMKVISVPTEDGYAALADADYVILRVLRLDAKTIEAMPRLKLIQRWGVGFEKVDIQAAGRRGVPVAVAPGGNATAVAELALLLMLAVLRNLVPLHEGVVQGRWEKEKFIDNSFVLKGKTVGLLGCGAIGASVARKVRAFDAEVVYHDLQRLPAADEQRLGLTWLPRDELLARADLVSLHLPLTDATRRTIDAAAIARMKRGAVLVNTARGEVVDSQALAAALRSGQLGGAGLDVFDTEPLAADSPLRGLPNVVMTPHAGGNTRDIDAEMVEICVDHVLAVDAGRPLPPRVVVNSAFLPA